MPCKNCLQKPVIKLTNSNIQLCKQHFIKYFEKKILNTIRNYKLIEKGDRIGVAISGGKDSLTVLNILNMLRNKTKKFEIEAIAIDEGIKGYRDKTLENAKKFCKDNNIKLHIFSYKDEFGDTLDNFLKKTNMKACSICGPFRRYLLNKKSKELGFNKLATGHNLDDEAQTIIMNYFRRNIETSARLGPITGIVNDKRFIRRIKPLYFMTQKETATYAFLKNLLVEFNECPYSIDSYRGDVMEMLNNFEAKYPGTKNSIITSFLEILPLLHKHYKNYTPINNCKICNEPCSQEICQTCKIVESLKNKVKKD
ncbi:MAG: TIGR00269 family protein [Nanoarchaeota archaeon]